MNRVSTLFTVCFLTTYFILPTSYFFPVTAVACFRLPSRAPRSPKGDALRTLASPFLNNLFVVIFCLLFTAVFLTTYFFLFTNYFSLATKIRFTIFLRFCKIHSFIHGNGLSVHLCGCVVIMILSGSLFWWAALMISLVV